MEDKKAPGEEAAAPRETKKGRWDTVLAYTPVVLTVLATLLAGQSSTQMSLAQYHRALAAQHQAKAGDQWSFFQAKRIRGENFEASADLAELWGGRAPVEPGRILDSLDHLSQSIRHLQEDAGRLVQNLTQTPETQLGRDADTAAIGRHAAQLLESTRREVAEVDSARTAMHKLFAEAGETQSSVSAALRYLNPPYPALREGQFDDPTLRSALEAVRAAGEPERETESRSAATRALDTVLEAIRQRRTDMERMPELAAVDVHTLQRSLATVAADATAFDEWSTTTERVIDSTIGPVRRAVAASSTVNQAVEHVEGALADTAAIPDELHSLAGPLVQKRQTLRTTAERVARDVLTGRHTFTAWRYEIEARYNQTLAELYEVQVFKSSAEASRYLKRSWGYFYAQLAVQAAVTVATLALAVRQRNALWGLACAASAIALVYASAVLLDAAPVPGV